MGVEFETVTRRAAEVHPQTFCGTAAEAAPAAVIAASAAVPPMAAILRGIIANLPLMRFE
jgi:hypothetical protein